MVRLSVGAALAGALVGCGEVVVLDPVTVSAGGSTIVFYGLGNYDAVIEATTSDPTIADAFSVSSSVATIAGFAEGEATIQISGQSVLPLGPGLGLPIGGRTVVIPVTVGPPDPLLVDSDGDGVPDGFDGCPNDPAKIVAGACGCGVVDSDPCGGCVDGDDDGDGVCNADDQCPGESDTLDTDGDGTPDCRDGCVDDPMKTAPGDCGCGTVDEDTNANGTSDCVEPMALEVRTVDASSGAVVAGVPFAVDSPAMAGLCVGVTSSAGLFTCPSGLLPGTVVTLRATDAGVAVGMVDAVIAFDPSGMTRVDLPVGVAGAGVSLQVRVRVGPAGWAPGATVQVARVADASLICDGTTDGDGYFTCSQGIGAGTVVRISASWTLEITYTGTVDVTVVDEGGGLMTIELQVGSQP